MKSTNGNCEKKDNSCNARNIVSTYVGNGEIFDARSLEWPRAILSTSNTGWVNDVVDFSGSFCLAVSRLQTSLLVS